MTGQLTMTNKKLAPPRPPLLARLKRAWTGESAAQIVEFAVSLPLLMLFVVGIFDFSNAVALKQKLTNAAREAARVAAADSANDLANPSTAVPASVGDAFQVVDNYLIADKVNDCGLATAASPAPTGLTWTYTSTGGGCPGTGISLLINRGCTSRHQCRDPQFSRNLHHHHLRIQVAVQQRGVHLWMDWCGHQQLDRKSRRTERELRIPYALANHPPRSKDRRKKN